MKKYKIFVSVYSLYAHDYVINTIVLETNDIYHEIGRIYCTSLLHINNISYFEL